MWKVLLNAGLGFATLDIGLRIRRLKRMAVLFAVAAVLALFGVGALLVAIGVLIEPRFGAAGAAGVIGGVLVVIAALCAWAATWRPRRKARAPVVDRVRAELQAAGASVSQAVAPNTATTGGGRAKSLNIVLLAALAGIVLGRKL
ncbi:phage holin family protein [Methylopila henanensis]|uniref:Phage holin family protein n=1 Tax=Methylopila henanensis TaxID=873516 RepID=A0ABW4K3Y5_9HYPH